MAEDCRFSCHFYYAVQFCSYIAFCLLPALFLLLHYYHLSKPFTLQFLKRQNPNSLNVTKRKLEPSKPKAVFFLLQVVSLLITILNIFIYFLLFFYLKHFSLNFSDFFCSEINAICLFFCSLNVASVKLKYHSCICECCFL